MSSSFIRSIEYCLDWPLVGVDNTTGIAIFNWSELTTTIGGFLWGFGLFYVIASVVAYILRRRYSVYLQRRGCLLIYVTSLGLLPLLHGLEYREFTGRENYPCALFLFVQFATFPLFITPYAIRTYLLYQRYRYKRLQVLYWENNNGKASMEQRTTANFAKIPDKPACRVTKAQLARVKRRSTEWYGTKLLIGFSLFVLLIYLAMILPRPYKYGMNCLGCDDDFFEIAILTVLDVAICSASLLALYKVHHEKDPLELISELKFSFLCNVGIVQTSLLLHVIDIGKAQRMGRWEWGHVIVVGLLAMFTCTIPYQLYKSWKNECKSTTLLCFEISCNSNSVANLVANDEDEINHILGDQQAGMFLLHYLNTEFSTENYYFYSNARFWEQQYDENSAEERSKLAKQIGA